MPSPRRLRLVAEIVQIALPIGLGLAFALTAVNIPFWDEWEWVDLVFKLHQGTLQFSDVWAQHNEHRIFFPQLIMLALDRFGGWSPVRELFVSLFLLICGQLALHRMILRTIDGWAASLATILVTIIYYGLWQAENLTWGFQMAWFLCDTACLMAIALLTEPQRRPRSTIAALLLAIVASFSSSQGLLVWAAGSVAIILTRRRIGPTLIVWLIAAAVSYWTYAYGLTPNTGGHFDMIHHPLAALQYALTYLGSPVAGWGGPGLSSCAGLIVVAALGFSAWADVRPVRFGESAVRRAPWYALAIFPLLASLATAGGRAGYGVDQALSSRYTSLSGLAWIAAIGIAATYAMAQSWPISFRQRQAAICATSIAVFALFLARSDAGGWHFWKRTEQTLASARSELEQNDPSALGKLYPVDARIRMLIEKLRRVHDGPFLNG